MPVEIKMKTSSAGNNDQFFMKMLPSSAQQDYKAVSAKGVKFNLAFYSVTADLSCVGQPNVSVTLPTSTTSLLKGNADQVVLEASIMQLIALLGDVKKAVLGGEKVGPLDNGMPKPAPNFQSIPKNEIPAAIKKPVLMAKMEPTTKESSGGVVRLAQATQVGQPVRGSSGGSVYYAMALNNDLKLGIRVKKNGSVSIRAEGNPSPTEIQKLQKAGMSKAGSEHWSIHFDAIDVPVSRCIGAFLMGLEIPFDSQIMNFGQVQVEA